MNVGLSDFVRMSRAIASPAVCLEQGDVTEPESDQPLTVRVLRELAASRGTAAEIAAILNLSIKLVAATLSNMKRQNYVRVISMVPSRTCPAHLYAITAAGLRRIHRETDDEQG
jgi:predicted ArsR family transcriptional regulator